MFYACILYTYYVQSIYILYTDDIHTTITTTTTTTTTTTITTTTTTTTTTITTTTTLTTTTTTTTTATSVAATDVRLILPDMSTCTTHICSHTNITQAVSISTLLVFQSMAWPMFTARLRNTWHSYTILYL